MAEENIITISGLTKKFKDMTAVNNISLTVRKGAVFAFLGTNGAGKSTTINMLTTALQPTSGTARVVGYELGKDDSSIRQAIGVVFQQSLLDPLLTVRENLRLRATFYALKDTEKRIAELSKLIGLNDFLDHRYGKLSGGQRRRADIARALVHKPKLLFLDEPTAGLDPKSREDVWKTVMNLQVTTGLTVFLTTHYMEEAERADDVYVISKGVIVAHDTPQALRAKYTTNTLTLVAENTDALLSKLNKSSVRATSTADTIIIHTASVNETIGLLKKYGADITDFEFRHGDMDDVFLSLTSKVQEMEDRQYDSLTNKTPHTSILP